MLRAQLTPPPLPPPPVYPEGIYQWGGGAGTLIWGDAANWSHPTDDDAVPPPSAAVLFGEVAGTGAADRLVITSSTGSIEADSLWFDAWEMGPSYTLAGDMITLGTGGAASGDLISVKGWQWSRETRIFAPEIVVHESVGSVVRLTNESYAGLLIGGGVADDSFDVGARSLQIRGGGLTHIASDIKGMTAANAIDVQGHRTQLILSGRGFWSSGRALNISNLGAVVIKNSNALSGFSNTVNVDAEGTLMLRSVAGVDFGEEGFSGSPVDISGLIIRVSAGEGAARWTDLETGTPMGYVGAIYNDGGDNKISATIMGTGPAGDVHFHSRAGTLAIDGWIGLNQGGAVLNFVKDGAGTIVLRRYLSDFRNAWGQTTITQGELRIENSQWALVGGFGVTAQAAASALHFAAAPGLSAVLGLGAYDTNSRFTRKVGTGVSWSGSGGFVSRGTDRTVALTNRDDEEGGLLYWHRDGFMGAMDSAPDAGGHELQLGSETAESSWGTSDYANTLFWENEIDFGDYAQFQTELAALQPGAVYSRERTVNVLDGLVEMQGALHGTGFDFAKRGKGVLRLANTGSDYTGATAGEVASTRIYDGALEGAANNLDFTNVVLAGGVYMPNKALLSEIPGPNPSYLFDVVLGTGAGEFRWDAGRGGGFATGAGWDSGELIIRIGDPTAALAWGDQYFVASGQELILGHSLSRPQLTWDKALSLGSGSQTIRAVKTAGGPPTRITQSISGGAGHALNIVGGGRLVLEKENSLSRLNIAGTHVELDAEGTLIDTAVYIGEWGELTLWGTGDQSSRLGTGGLVDLSGGGLLRYQDFGGLGPPIIDGPLPGMPGGPGLPPPGGGGPGPGAPDSLEKVAFGKLRLSGGAAQIEIGGSSILHFSELERAHERTTLNIVGPLLEFTTANVDYAEFDDFFPWATVNDTTWVAASGSTGQWGAMAQSALNGGAPSTWTSSSHALVWEDWNAPSTGAVLLDQSLTIRSLIVEKGLDLQGHTLTLGSGGLIINGPPPGYGGGASISGGAGSALTTGGGNGGGAGGAVPLYVHTRDYAEIGVALTGGMDVVKAGIGTLSLTGSGHSQVGAVYIHDGRLELNLGSEGSFYTTGRITVGDRGGQDVLRLPKYDHQITGSRDILLRGGDYGAGVLEFARSEPTSGGNVFAGTAHQFSRLEIEGRGVIDFRGGDAGVANYLYLDELIIDVGSLLTVLNWFEGESFLLVRNTSANQGYIRDNVLGGAAQRIQFDGYDRVYTSHYNDDYFEITAFPRSPLAAIPEPSTTGALLGALGVGAYLLRRRKRGRDATSRRGPNEGLAK